MLLLSFERRGIANAQSGLHAALRFLNSLLASGTAVYQSLSDVRLKTERFPEGRLFPGGTVVCGAVSGAAGEPLFCDGVDDAEFAAREGAFRKLSAPGPTAFYAGLNSADFCSVPYRRVLESMGFEFTPLTDEDIREGRLDDFELLIVPGGPDAGESYYQGLGERGFDNIRNFVRGGGRYLGSCAGSYLPLTGDTGTPENRMWLNLVPALDKSGLDYWRTGAGFVRVSFRGGGPLTFGLDYGNGTTLDVIYWEGPVFSKLGEGVEVFARFESFIASGDRPPFWDLGSSGPAAELPGWYNALDAGRFEAHMSSQPAALRAKVGKGKAVLYSFHPEFGYPNCSFESDPVHLLIANAIYDLFLN